MEQQLERYDAQMTAMHERIRMLEGQLELAVGDGAKLPQARSSSSKYFGTEVNMHGSNGQDAAATLQGSMGEDETLLRHWGDQYVYAGSSGAIGALSVLFGGCASKVIIETIGGNNQLVRATPLLFVVGMLVCVLVQTHLLNRAMMVGDNMS